MQPKDISRVAELHHRAMGNSLWAKLGLRFLRSVYKAMLSSPHFLGFVYEEGGEIGGFIAGSQNTEEMLANTFRRAWPVLGIKAFPRILQPRVLKRLLETHRYTNVSGAEDLPESLFCSFKKNLRGRRISGHINKVLFDELLARGHKSVKITTEVDNEGANRQLTSWGFSDEGRFNFYGKEMVLYVLDLENSDRVEPISRHPAV